MRAEELLLSSQVYNHLVCPVHPLFNSVDYARCYCLVLSGSWTDAWCGQQCMAERAVGAEQNKKHTSQTANNEISLTTLTNTAVSFASLLPQGVFIESFFTHCVMLIFLWIMNWMSPKVLVLQDVCFRIGTHKNILTPSSVCTNFGLFSSVISLCTGPQRGYICFHLRPTIMVV